MEEQRKSHKGLWVIGAVVVILLFCAFFFRVKKVSIEGNTYYSSREMEEKFQSNIFEKNILTFWLMQKLSLTPDLPFVREYEVSYPSTNEIHIKLYEKSIVAGIAYSNQYIYFDKDGIVLQSSDKAVKGIPLFETKNLTTFTLYSKVQMEDDSLLNQILNLAKRDGASPAVKGRTGIKLYLTVRTKLICTPVKFRCLLVKKRIMMKKFLRCRACLPRLRKTDRPAKLI